MSQENILSCCSPVLSSFGFVIVIVITLLIIKIFVSLFLLKCLDWVFVLSKILNTIENVVVFAIIFHSILKEPFPNISVTISNILLSKAWSKLMSWIMQSVFDKNQIVRIFSRFYCDGGNIFLEFQDISLLNALFKLEILGGGLMFSTFLFFAENDTQWASSGSKMSIFLFLSFVRFRLSSDLESSTVSSLKASFNPLSPSSSSLAKSVECSRIFELLCSEQPPASAWRTDWEEPPASGHWRTDWEERKKMTESFDFAFHIFLEKFVFLLLSVSF